MKEIWDSVNGQRQYSQSLLYGFSIYSIPMNAYAVLVILSFLAASCKCYTLLLLALRVWVFRLCHTCVAKQGQSICPKLLTLGLNTCLVGQWVMATKCPFQWLHGQVNNAMQCDYA